jgi:protein-S-isoprenylcysteine O-methyltransferase Ste14
MPTVVRASGVIVLVLGFGVMGWLLRYRKPIDILTSTYVTMRKAVRGTANQNASSRTEPLILQGPHRHVRHPLYFAVAVLVIGWWLVLDYTLVLCMAVEFFLWFDFVVIRFEEQELRTLYGEEYNAYAKVVPRFFPCLKCKWH